MIPLSLSQDADAEKEVGVENQKTVNFVNGSLFLEIFFACHGIEDFANM